jgi:signal transduction histidine kinase
MLCSPGRRFGPFAYEKSSVSVLLNVVGLVLALLFLIETISAGPFPTDPRAAALALASAILLELRATKLAGGFFSAATAWCMILSVLPGVGLPCALFAVGGALAVRLAWRSKSWTQFSGYWLTEFWPAALCAWATKRWGLVGAVPVYLVAAAPLPLLLSTWFEPSVRVGKRRAELLPEHVSLVAAGAAGTLLAQRHPALVLLLLPVLWVLMRSAGIGEELAVQREFRSKVEQAKKDISQHSQKLGQTAGMQATMERTLTAREQAFALLEGLSARPVSERQALEEALQALEKRVDGVSCTFVEELPPGVDGAPLSAGQPWVDPTSSQAAWSVAGRGVVLVRSATPLRPESVQALTVFFRYLGVALDRVRFQATILRALETEAGLRAELSAAVTRLRGLLHATAELATLVEPRATLEFAIACIREWTHGRNCGARYGQVWVGSDAGTLRFPLPDGELVVEEAGMEQEEREALELWAILVHNSLERCRAQSALLHGSKLAAIGQLAAGVAHELNSPLGAINVSLGMALKSAHSNPDKTLARIEKAKKSVEQTRNIVAKLLHFARESTSDREAVELSTIVKDALQIVEHSFKLEGVELNQDILDATVTANAGELQQITVNLLVNARQAVQGRPDARVSLRVFPRGDCAYIEVCDNGPGVPPEVVERIFEPFFSTKDVGHGLGLGLSLSRELAIAHGGDLSYCPPPDGGACFQLKVPRL